MPEPRVTHDQENSKKMYLALMEEAKVRIAVINHTCNNDAGFPPEMVREICYLQFRFLCEIIALGCLAVHGDIKKTTALRKTYQADKIIAQMEELKPHFYPQRIEWKLDKGDKRIIGRPDLPHLSQNELKQLWSEAGNCLHRTPMVKLSEPESIVKKLKPVQSNPENFADIFEWGEKIAGLLDCHLITLEENKKVMSVSLISDDTTSVKVSILDFDTETKTVDVSSLKFGEFR